MVPVRNAMPYLPKCLYSLVGQSIGLDSIEIVAIDDVSSDESRIRLDRFSRAYRGAFKLINRDSPAGGDAHLVNAGLDAATGRYVLFLQPDDYLDAKALELMVAAADEHGSDVVVPRAVDLRGEPISSAVFTETENSADLYGSTLPFLLSGTALYRRDALTRRSLRHREDFGPHSELHFALQAWAHAERITALGDHNHHFAVRRLNGANQVPVDLTSRLRAIEAIFDETAWLLESGAKRDAITHRLFAVEVADLVGEGFIAQDQQSRELVGACVRRVAGAFLTDAVNRRLDVTTRVRIALAAGGHYDALAEAILQEATPQTVAVMAKDGRLFAQYRGFRDTDFGLPDDLFEILSGQAEWIASRLRVAEVAWQSGREGRTLVVTSHSAAEPAGLGQSVPRMTIGQVAGRVTLQSLPGNEGTLLRATFDLGGLLDRTPDGGARREVRVQLDLDGTSCDVPLLATPIDMPSQFLRHGARPYRLRPFRDSRDRLVIEVAPVTLRKVARRVKRDLIGR
nr:glycosyltransferase family 2 protein [Catellatospora sichuanensis]